jgi:glutamate racemase
MIGVFDSGHGGLTILEALTARLPRQRFVYLGDHASAPYGDRPNAQIYDLTRASVQRLFELGCGLVILACNTASTIALRKLQQEWLPQRWPERRVLGVVVPTIEAITGTPWLERDRARLGLRIEAGEPRTVGIFATAATVASEVFPIEIAKRAPHIRVVQQACAELVGQIEGDASRATMAATIAGCARELRAKLDGAKPDAIVLGCTHYPLVSDLFQAEVDGGVEIVSQPLQVALALADYLDRHPEFKRSDENPKTILLTTGRPAEVSQRAGHLFGRSLTFAQA